MGKSVDKMTVRLSTRWWFLPSARLLAVAAMALPSGITSGLINFLCKHGTSAEVVSA